VQAESLRSAGIRNSQQKAKYLPRAEVFRFTPETRHCPARRLNDPPHITLTIDGSADGRVLITTLQVDRANPVTGASRRIYKFTGQLCLILARPFARKFHDPLIRLVATLSNKHDLSGLTFDT
jgi:hypothetical protein